MYITSKMASAVDYAFYKQGANKVNVVVKTIHINGGADVVNKRTLETPSGVVTELSDDDINMLKTHPLFIEHQKNGFVAICGSEKEAKKADKTLEEDKSSQITPQDYEKGNSKKDMTGGKRKPNTKK